MFSTSYQLLFRHAIKWKHHKCWALCVLFHVLPCVPTYIIFPVDATITFNNGLTVSWGGQSIGTMKLDPVGIVGDVGATLNVQTTFEIANVEYMASFTKV